MQNGCADRIASAIAVAQKDWGKAEFHLRQEGRPRKWEYIHAHNGAQTGGKPLVLTYNFRVGVGEARDLWNRGQDRPLQVGKAPVFLVVGILAI